MSDIPVPFAPVLETPRLILRAPQAGDEPHFLALMGDAENSRFIGGPQAPDLAWRGFAALVGHWHLRGYGVFCVIEKETGAWAGRVGAINYFGWPSPEIGWTIHKSRWGRGYATEAAAAALDWAVGQLGWERTIHLIVKENTPSQAVARKLGSADTGDDVYLPFADATPDVWGQSAADWAGHRRRFSWLDKARA
jgi:RimJ/RimL family protein N-acetyltransferase